MVAILSAPSSFPGLTPREDCLSCDICGRRLFSTSLSYIPLCGHSLVLPAVQSSCFPTSSALRSSFPFPQKQSTPDLIQYPWQFETSASPLFPSTLTTLEVSAPIPEPHRFEDFRDTSRATLSDTAQSIFSCHVFISISQYPAVRDVPEPHFSHPRGRSAAKGWEEDTGFQRVSAEPSGHLELGGPKWTLKLSFLRQWCTQSSLYAE